MNTVKVFDKAEEMANFIKDDVAKLDVLVNDTKNTVYDMNKTMSEFEELKNMHNTILDYAESIRKEKESLKDTQEKVNMLVEMSEEVQNKFIQIAESNSMIENTQEGIKVVIDIASQIENKLAIINDKEEQANTILEKVNIADNESDDILQRIDTIKSAMLDIEDTRREFSDKMFALDREMAKIDKNDEKVQKFFSKLEELNVIIEEIQNQRENLKYMKKQYEDYDNNIVKNLERAEYFVRYLETLLDNAEKYVNDAGKSLTKRSKTATTKINDKKENIIINMYKQGWKYDEIVKNTSYDRDEVERVIKKWKDESARGY